jgi:hypothetical protein
MVILVFFVLSLFLFAINISDLALPFYWDTAWYLIPISKLIHENGLLSFILYPGSDYPHIFLLPSLLSLAFYFSEPRATIVVHIIGILLSIFFLFVTYKLAKTFLDKRTAILILLLVVSNPIFLSQTFLVYFEIIGLALRLLTLKFFLEKRPKAFLITSILAIFTRIDNFIFISFMCLSIFLDRKQKIKEKVSFLIKYYLPSAILTFAWFLSNKIINGWWFYSPQRYFDEKHLQSFIKSLQIIFISQGRWTITIAIVAGLIILFLQKRLKLIFNRKLLVFFFATFPTLMMITVLGYVINRYTLPLIIFNYYLLVIILNSIKIKKQKLLKIALIILFLSIIQFNNKNNCFAVNQEDCLLVKQVIRKDINK